MIRQSLKTLMSMAKEQLAKAQESFDQSLRPERTVEQQRLVNDAQRELHAARERLGRVQAVIADLDVILDAGSGSEE